MRLFLYSIVAFFCSLISVPLLGQVEQTAFGIIDDSYAVNAAGAYNHTIPLYAPPGVNGMSPQLALVYDSRAGISELGYGWAITGLSKITRGPNNFAQHGKAAAVTFTAGDVFLLDGQYMSCTEGTNGGSQSKYKTENESFSVIWSIGSISNSDASPRYFVVKQANGMTYYYGSVGSEPGDARLPVKLRNGKTEVVEWHVSRIEDVYGNFMAFEYKNDVNNAIRIESISYTGNSKLNLEPLSKVVFRYHETSGQVRKKSNTTFIAGVPFKNENLLRSIALMTDGKYFKHYHFTYDKSYDHLIEMKESSDEEGKIALPALKIEWENWRYGGYSLRRYAKAIPKDLVAIDLNRDGRPEYVSLKPIPLPLNERERDTGNSVPVYSMRTHLDKNLELAYQNSIIIDRKAVRPPGIDPEKYVFVDMNGDFFPDLLTDTQIVFNYTFKESSLVYPSNFWRADNESDKKLDQEWIGHLSFIKDIFKKDNGTLIACDLDGDGRTEIAALDKLKKELRIYGFKIKENSFVELFDYAHSDLGNAVLKKLDITGSGTEDLFLFFPKKQDATRFSRKGDNIHVSRFSLPTSFPLDFAHQVKFLDFNTDGTLDAYLERPGEKLKVWIFNGIVFENSQPFETPDIFSSPGNEPNKIKSYLGYFTTRKHLQILRSSNIVNGFFLSNIVFKGPGEMNFESVAAFDLPFGYDENFNANDDFQFTDVDGDGDVDINWESTGYNVNDAKDHYNYFFENNSDFEDKVTSVSDGIGNTVKIKYSTLNDASVYKAQVKKLASNYSLYSGLYTVVSRIEYTAGVSNEDMGTISYFYEDLVAENTGRGLAGFRKRTVRDHITGLTNKVTYEYEFPLTGKIIDQHTTDAKNQVIYSMHNDWAFRLYDLKGKIFYMDEDDGPQDRDKSKTIKTEPADTLKNIRKAYHEFGRWSNIRLYEASSLVHENDITLTTNPKSFIKSLTEFNRRGLSYLAIVKTSYVIKPEPGSNAANATEIFYQYDELGYPLKTAQVSNDREIVNAKFYRHINADHTVKSIYLLGLVTEDSNYVEDFEAERRSEPRVTHYSYADNGSLLQKIRSKGSADYEHVTSFDYDESGNIISKTLFRDTRLQTQETFQYTKDKRFLGEYTNAMGHKSYYEYEHRFGRRISEMDHSRTNVIRNKYDDFGNLLKTEFPDKTFIAYDYHVIRNKNDELFRENTIASFKITVSESGGEPQDFYYDRHGNELLRVYSLIDSGAGDVNKTRQISKQRRVLKAQSFDTRGNLENDYKPFYIYSRTGSTGQSEWCRDTEQGYLESDKYSYDAHNRILHLRFANDSEVKFENLHQKRIQYSTKNERTVQYYNGRGEQVAVRDDQGNELTYQYDVWGNVTRIVSPNGEKLENVYDCVGRKIRSTDPALGTTVYEYDKLDRVIKESNGDKTVRLSYDRLNRIIAKEMNEGTILWKYDNQIKGKIDSIIDTEGNITSYIYDRFGRITSETQTVSGKKYKMSYVYDRHARLSAKTFPNGYKLGYEYSNNVPVKIFELKPNGSSKLIWHLTAVNEEGLILEKKYGNGLITNYEYDRVSGMLISIKTGKSARQNTNEIECKPAWTGNIINFSSGTYDPNKTFYYDDSDRDLLTGEALSQSLQDQHERLQSSETDADIIQSLSMAYDRDHRLIQKVDSVHKFIEGYTYDNLNRLSSMMAPADSLRKKVSISYDPNGNIVFKSDVGNYEYSPGAKQQLKMIRSNGIVTAEYSYDNYGNVVSENKKGLAIQYASFNKPLSIVMGESRYIVKYRYDQRELESFSYKDKKPGSHRIVPFNDYTVIEENGKSVAMNYILVGNDLVAVHFESGNESYNHYIHKDNIGSVQLITDESGKMITEYRYHAFGKRVNVYGNSSTIRNGFTGHQALDDFDLINFGARIYDPNTGRFFSADPFVQAPSDLQSLNRYSYVLNNPLNIVDPSGYWGIRLRAPRITWNPGRDIGRGINNIGRAIGQAHEDIYNEGDRFIDKHGKEIVVYAAAIAITYFSGGTASGLAGVMIKGAIFGASLQGGMTAAYGGSFQEVLNAAFKGAYTGAASAAVFYGIGSAFSAAQINTEFGTAGYFAKTAAHGVTGGVQSELLGGDFQDGFLGASVAHALAPVTESAFAYQDQVLERVLFSAAVGGLSAYASGGDVVMGMTTAGYSRWFNCESKFIAKTLYDIFKRPSQAYQMANSYQKGDYLSAGGRVLQLTGGILSCVPTPQTRLVGTVLSYTGAAITNRNLPGDIHRIMSSSSPGSDDGLQPGPKY